jgi:hypothetical protein
MSCNKHTAAVALIGLVLGSAVGTACAATTPSLAGALTPAPAVRTVSASLQAPASQATAAQAHAASAPSTAVTQTQPQQAAQPQPTQPQPQPDAVDSHLTLGEIDTLARNKLASTLRGTPDAAVASSPALTTKPLVTDPKPHAPAPPAPVYTPRAHVEPVAFLGAYSDGLGQHVLYQYNGSVYPALIGEKLLNGWIARRVDGQMVTVSEGRATRHIAMSGDAQAAAAVMQPSAFGAGPSLLGDLSQPLPRGMVSMPIIQSGR